MIEDVDTYLLARLLVREQVPELAETLPFTCQADG